MEVVAEALLSASVEALFSKLGSSDVLKFARQDHVQAELKKWETKLLGIREVLNDAEDKQITEQSVKAWLGELRDLAYDMEDVLDEYGYEALRRKVMSEADNRGTTRTSKVRKLIPSCCTTFSPVRNVKMGSKIRDITRRVEEISARKAGLGLKCLDKVEMITRSSWERRPVTTSEVYLPRVKGREADKQNIIEMLLKNESAGTNVSVVSIVAMGGMGKTTLARLVYDDTAEPIASHFAIKAWVCVSNEFDKVRVTKVLLNSVSSQPSNSEDFHEIQREFKKALAGKRFLIVLDDLWSDIYSKWDDLRSPLFEGAPGSKILVTTRDHGVATWVGGHKNLYELKQLSEDDCWSVFQTHAFEHININEHQNLETIGRSIVKKCGGLPLAAKAIGGLLRSELREREWERILDSKIWDLPIDKCEIIPALRLSYNHLPSHLKRCFAYCAIFPQDYEFKKEELIPLWRAEGLIQQSKDDRRKENVGDKYFCELLSRSFFQSSNSSESLFTMHDLVNDLAKYVAGETCIHLDEEFKNNWQCPIPESARHSSFIRGRCDIFKMFERFHKTEHLRTFIVVPTQNWDDRYISNKVLQELIPRLRYLRVLCLSGYKIVEIPKEFCDLKLLRYLNLSKTDITCLPDSIGNLYNLQTLILSYCYSLTKLPNSIGNLINLRCLDVSGYNCVEEMPSQVGKLKDLQILSNFMVGKNNGLNIKELREMSCLEGELCISKLENVVNVEDVRDAGLKLKNNLERLTLKWSSNLDGSRNDEMADQMNVLQSLQPHSNLGKLGINSYGGLAFPGWVSDASLLSKMVELSLVDCKKCTSLPCLGQFPSLKRLRIQGMDGVKQVGAEFYFYGEVGVSVDKFFPSLESLYFEDMPEWEDWSSSSATESLFPSLHELKISNCPKLIKELPTYLPLLTMLYVHDCPKLEFTLLRLPSIKVLYVKEFDETIFQSKIELTSLTRLRVDSILELINLKQGFVRSLIGLQDLGIWNCKKLTCLWEDRFESEGLIHSRQLVSLGLGCNLRSLEISNCDKLERLPNEWQSLTCLERLIIHNCPKLVSFPEVGFPPNLRSLTLSTCEGLKCLPDGMTSKMSTNSCLLENLEIRNCSSLICFPKGQLPTTLKKLRIIYCASLSSLPEGMMMRCNSIHTNNTITMGICALEALYIAWCPSLADFPEGSLPTTLKELIIEDCENLKSLPEGVMHQHYSSNTTANGALLQVLCLYGCPSLTSFPKGKFPSTLKRLNIMSCEQLESISEEMFHSSTNSSLQYVSIKKYPNLKALPDCLSDLSDINIRTCKSLELRPHQFQNFTSLKSLVIKDCENINNPLSQWGLTRLPSLKILSIGAMFSHATSFSDDNHMILLPTTLTSLSLSKFQNLKSLESLSLQTLTSLQDLNVVNCPKLQSILPREGLLPDTLSQLSIRRCPVLKQRFSKEDGEDWPKIAHIPYVEIHDLSISEL